MQVLPASGQEDLDPPLAPRMLSSHWLVASALPGPANTLDRREKQGPHRISVHCPASVLIGFKPEHSYFVGTASSFLQKPHLPTYALTCVCVCTHTSHSHGQQCHQKVNQPAAVCFHYWRKAFKGMSLGSHPYVLSPSIPSVMSSLSVPSAWGL